jgi:hypothetical protein
MKLIIVSILLLGGEFYLALFFIVLCVTGLL